MIELGSTLLSWWATAWLHGLILLSLVFALDKLGVLKSPVLRESAWRAALLLPLLSSAAQWVWVEQPLAGRHALWNQPQQIAVAADAPLALRSSLPRSEHAVTATHQRAAKRPAEYWPRAPLVEPRGERPASAIVAGNVGPQATSDAFAGNPSLWAAASGWLWSLIAVAGLLRIAALWQRERRRIERLSPLRDAALAREISELSQQTGLRRPRLAADPQATSPVAWSPATICLPPWSLSALNRPQRRAMLAHEMAHLLRRDPQWQLALSVMAAVLPLPGASHARARLAELAEHACDAWSAQAMGDGRPLAEALATCAQYSQTGYPASRFVAPMARPRSALVERIHRLIEENPMRHERPSLRARVALTSGLLAAVLILPGIAIGESPAPKASATTRSSGLLAPPAPPAPPAAPTPPAPVAPSAPPASEAARGLAPEPPAVPAPPVAPAPPAPPAKSGRFSFNRSNSWFGKNSVFEVEDGSYALRFEADGEFRLNASEDDLASLDDEVILEETRDGITRRIEFEKSRGQIERRFFVDGKAAAYDEAARRWQAETLRSVIREAGIDVEARVKRLYASGGAAAVFAEIEQIHGSHGRVVYLGQLLAQPGLDSTSLERAIAMAGSVDSDYEKRAALSVALKQASLSSAQQVAVLKIAADFKSDYERRVLLQLAAERLPSDAAVQNAWLQAVDRSKSDYEHRVALQAAADSNQLLPATVRGLIASTHKIDSNYERRVALQAIAPRLQHDASLALPYAEAVASMDSDYERRVALQMLAEQVALDATSSAAAIDAARSIKSGYERSVALQAIAERMPADVALIERASAAARGLSDHERGRVERALDKLRG